jgi:hypothetical protein
MTANLKAPVRNAGIDCIVLVADWSDIVHRYLFNTQTYPPVLACCYALARQLERGTARILPPR